MEKGTGKPVLNCGWNNLSINGRKYHGISVGSQIPIALFSGNFTHFITGRKYGLIFSRLLTTCLGAWTISLVETWHWGGVGPLDSHNDKHMINKTASCQTMREITNLGRGNYPFKNMVFPLVFQLAPSWGERCFMFCYVLGPFRPAKTRWRPR